jgi:hypothetical protein
MTCTRFAAASMALCCALLLPACGEEGTTGGSAPASIPTPATNAPTPAALNDGTPIVYDSGTVEIRPGMTTVYADPADVDFGVTRPGTKLRAEFRLVNPTNAPIKILAAQPTCQCTTVKVSNQVIPPRGAIGIPATLQVPNTTGLKQAAINTALEPGVSGPRLTLKAVAAYAVRTDPLYVDALEPERLTGQVTVESTDGRPFRVRSVNGRPPLLQTPDEPSVRHIVGYDLTGETPDTMPKWLLFETDHPEAPMLEMRVRHQWSMLPHQFPDHQVAIQFDGYIANLGAIPAGSPAPFSLQLKHFAGQRVLGLRSDAPEFRVALTEQIPGDDDRVRITATITPAEGTSGPFIVPITFDATTGSEQMYAIGVVRPEAPQGDARTGSSP